MSLTETRIQEAAAKNKELLRILAETDHAIPDLMQQRRLISDLETQFAESGERIKQLDSWRAKELKEHVSYRDSVLRRFAYKVAGKQEAFDSKAKKEETEYFEVLQQEHREKRMNDHLAAQIDETNNARKEMEQLATRHITAQQELDSIYHAIFSGPTPGFPEEDEKEKLATAALQAYQDARGRTEAEVQAVRLLREGQTQMARALESMGTALTYSRSDIMGGSSFSDMMERNALSSADHRVHEARMSVFQAKQMSPAVGDLPPVSINQGHVLRDMFFDNIFTDLAFHDEIKRGQAQVQTAANVLQQLAESARLRVKDLESALGEREQDLETARDALQKVREDAFRKVVG